jgi:hypothetical protein
LYSGLRVASATPRCQIAELALFLQAGRDSALCGDEKSCGVRLGDNLGKFCRSASLGRRERVATELHHCEAEHTHSTSETHTKEPKRNVGNTVLPLQEGVLPIRHLYRFKGGLSRTSCAASRTKGSSQPNPTTPWTALHSKASRMTFSTTPLLDLSSTLSDALLAACEKSIT